ncbi:MAG TPA: ParB/RepB/Spo0J family partition protein [Firmicutes bacterium]|nr:ParB/RepB/Spo0J family partition protein [Bacillota bacterium]
MAKALGKGFAALFPETDLIKDEEVVQEIAVDEIRPNPYQPRKNFNDDAIEELKTSIMLHGILQPIIVRKSIKGYELVAGERRLRASQLANLEKIPAIVRKLTDDQMMLHALLENLQREDLNVVEEAKAYETLIKNLKITHEELAKRVGKSRSHISNLLRLLELPNYMITSIVMDEISMGHGRALLAVKDEKICKILYHQVIDEGLTVRELEKKIQELQQQQNVSRETSKKKKIEKSMFVIDQEERLSNLFGTKVRINEMKKKGKIEIDYYSPEDLERVLAIIDKK